MRGDPLMALCVSAPVLSCFFLSKCFLVQLLPFWSPSIVLPFWEISIAHEKINKLKALRCVVCVCVRNRFLKRNQKRLKFFVDLASVNQIIDGPTTPCSHQTLLLFDSLFFFFSVLLQFASKIYTREKMATIWFDWHTQFQTTRRKATM